MTNISATLLAEWALGEHPTLNFKNLEWVERGQGCSSLRPAITTASIGTQTWPNRGLRLQGLAAKLVGCGRQTASWAKMG